MTTTSTKSNTSRLTLSTNQYKHLRQHLDNYNTNNKYKTESKFDYQANKATWDTQRRTTDTTTLASIISPTITPS